MTAPSAPDAVNRLGAAYHSAHYAANPLAATEDGVAGYDAEMPDPSREADERHAAHLASLADELGTVDEHELAGEDWLSYRVLDRFLRYEHDTHRHGLREVAVSASIFGFVPAVLGTVPAASVATPVAAEAYLSRLGKIGEFFDRLGARHVAAAADGRFPTELGVRQAIAQIDTYLATPLESDPLLRPSPGKGVDVDRWRAQAADLVSGSIRPAMARYRSTLEEGLLPVGRGDGEVGVNHIPGGAEGYLAAVQAHTTTDLAPADIHRMGLDLVARLRDEFAERGGRTLGTADVDEVLTRLREDPALRFGTSAEIVDAVTDALRRAENALPDWFQAYDIAPCVVSEMDPVEAEGSVLGYYRPPAADASRPGAHVVNTLHPHLRPRYEYEALAFHESVPGHHLQMGIAQSLTALPEFRRFAYLTAHAEGWALYTERLCDEMGLYSDDLSRLGMVSFDAWRACRLVVDTGMHYQGWSRQRAIDYMRANTALSDVNIANEVDRYIADPGQALGYMVGRIRLRELRDRYGAHSGQAIKAFHHEVLGHGPLPLDTLDIQLSRALAGQQ